MAALACLVFYARFVSVEPLVLNLTQCNELRVDINVVGLAWLIRWCFNLCLLLFFKELLLLLEKIIFHRSQLLRLIVSDPELLV